MWLLGLVVAMACSHSPGPGPAAVRLYKSDTAIPEKEDARLPLWLVDVDVAQGQRGLARAVAIVDTGAQTTVVDRAWADAHGLVHATAAVVAKDISGASIQTSVAQDVRLQFGPFETRPVDFVVIDMPEILRFLGIAVIWSPHTTVPDNAMLRLDFASGTMQLRDETEMVPSALPLCVGRQFGYAAPLVDATVGGHAARLELDSGASETSLSAISDAGVQLAQQASGKKTSHGAAGAFSTTTVASQSVQVGAYVHQSEVSLFEGSETAANDCPGDGVVGLPFLAHCVLDFTTTQFALRCPEMSASSAGR